MTIDHHILLIEDDQRLGKTFLQLFRNLSVHVAYAGDAKGAIERLDQERYDLMILDLQDHEFGKFANLLQVDHTPSCSHIILISDLIEKEDFRQILRCESIGYLTKPFDPMDLIAMIEDILKMHSS